ncbi:4411_t:CDS:2, partial [Acaulospora colombiana]
MSEPTRFPTTSRVLQIFVPRILEKSIKPIFLKYSKVQSDKRGGRTLKKQVLDFDNVNEQWRGEVAQAATLLYRCVLQMKCTEMEKMLGQIVPPTLSLIDDYDVKLKTLGVSTLDYLLKEVRPESIRRSGLGDVFYEALVNCLSYQSETSHLPLLRLSFSAIITLVSLVEPIEERSRYTKYEKILSDSVIRGFVYSGDKIAVRQVLLEQIPRLAEGLGIVIVKYLQDLIQNLCATLEVALDVPNKNEILNLHLTASKGIEVLITKCWP